MSDERELVAAIARAQIGNTDADPYFLDAAPCYSDGHASGKQWCGIFALWCLRQAGLCNWLWRDGYGFVYQIGWAESVTWPEPGDVAYYDSPYQHHAIVVEVDRAAGTVTTVDGNTGPAPGKVSLKSGARGRNGCLYYSIKSLLSADTGPDSGSDAVPDTEPAPAPTVSRTLRAGDTGQDVHVLQDLLRAMMVGGEMCPWTRRFVKAYQRAYGLSADGVPGPKTLGHMGLWRDT